MTGAYKKGIFNFITLTDAMAVEAYLPALKERWSSAAASSASQLPRRW